jgi:phage baseplate assembly protein gpV
MKAYKAGGSLTVEGGEFTVDAADDAFHANENIRVAAGRFSVKTGDDAFHADGALRIDDGEIDIVTCYEGLEGGTVDITGGDIFIEASDDAINAAGGSDETEARGPARRDRFTAADAYYVRISGGTIDALGGRDGIDANGDVYLEGGRLSVSAQSMGMEGAIDLDGRFIVTGGTLIAAGSAPTPSSESTQAVLLVSYTARHEAGSVLSLEDAAGNAILEYASRMAYTASAMSAPDMAQGQTYTLRIDGEEIADISLIDTVTAVADVGGAYAVSGGRRGGGFSPGGGEPAPGTEDGTRPAPQEGENFTPPGGGNRPLPQEGENFAPPGGGNRPAPQEGEGFTPPENENAPAS